MAEILSFHPNKISTRPKLLLLAVIIAAGNFFSSAFAAEFNPFDETTRILERSTSAHWGQDCFVSEELIAPWVEAEALRSGMSDAERENFRKDFVSQLRLNNSETFLVSVYSFGSRPANFSPVRDNISLLAASGERIKPTQYDNALDYPSGGVVQGLVFFPKQTNKDYVIAIRGMGRSILVRSPRNSRTRKTAGEETRSRRRQPPEKTAEKETRNSQARTDSSAPAANTAPTDYSAVPGRLDRYGRLCCVSQGTREHCTD